MAWLIRPNDDVATHQSGPGADKPATDRARRWRCAVREDDQVATNANEGAGEHEFVAMDSDEVPAATR